MITIRKELEVEAFLREFKPKFSVWGIIFLHRDKNEEALRALGITPVHKDRIGNAGKQHYLYIISRGRATS